VLKFARRVAIADDAAMMIYAFTEDGKLDVEFEAKLRNAMWLLMSRTALASSERREPNTQAAVRTSRPEIEVEAAALAGGVTGATTSWLPAGEARRTGIERTAA
jgi:hypothetical protein